MLAKVHGVAIEHVNNSQLRKEDLVSKVLAQRGDHPGLVHILSAMEAYSAYEPWHDKQTHKTYLRSTLGKCLHYYFYFMDVEVGLCYLRVPIWCPFHLQFNCNGHSWLAAKLTSQGIDFAMADKIRSDDLHRLLDAYAMCVAPCSKSLPRLIIRV